MNFFYFTIYLYVKKLKNKKNKFKKIMKRIIRLTESDLARIVKRVIKEQETSQLMPVSYTELDYNGNIISTTLNKGQNKFKVTPSYKMASDNKGNKTPNTNFLQLTVNVEGVANTTGRLEINCTSKTTTGISSTAIVADDANFCINVGGRPTSCGADASKVLRSTFNPNSPGWKYQGMVKEMGDKYCKTA